MDFGFTNNDARLRAAEAFRDAATADGWSMRATYGSEPIERASTLTRDGYTMQVLTRDNSEKKGKWKHEAQISIWGPDGLAINPPEIYDFAKLKSLTRHCNYCKTDDVDTQRVGFAGRCCAACLPAMRAKIETPGWTN
jgi:hypothetical protein